jgi:hypothetical protein
MKGTDAVTVGRQFPSLVLGRSTISKALIR